MSKPTFDSTHLSDRQLGAALRGAVARSNAALAQLLAHLAEWDRRKLYLEHPCSSLFVYCRDVLGMSEDEACRRIHVARGARSFPVLLERIASGALHLTGAHLLADHLTDENVENVLRRASGKSKREIEEIVAELSPKRDARAEIRKLPDGAASPPRPAPGGSGVEESALEPSAAAPPRAEVEGAPEQPSPRPGRNKLPRDRNGRLTPLAPSRYKVQFTAPREYVDLVDEARRLLAHAVPDGNLLEIHQRALDVLVADLRKKKHAATSRPATRRRASSDNPRYVPAAVRREVWHRDGGQCTYIGRDGKRCCETARLELHHVLAVALGGLPTVENITLRCRAHNAWEAEKELGRERVDAKVRAHRERTGANATRPPPPRAGSPQLDRPAKGANRPPATTLSGADRRPELGARMPSAP